jgi:peptidyl-prolyl cis-trans isomerase D
MLQFIRSLSSSKGGSIIVKLLFGALIACFGVWGIGDFLNGNNNGSSTILKVGDSSIGSEELTNAIQREAENTKQMFGGNLTHDQMKQLGVIDRAVDGVVDRALFDQEAKKLHLAAGLDEVARVISQDPAFQKNGVFDKDTYSNLLAANRMTEAQYIAMVQQGLPRQDLAQIAINNANAPDSLVNLLYAHRAEQRTASYIFLPTTSVGNVGTPDAAAMEKYYKAHIAAFTAPEYRSLTGLALTADAVAASIKVDDSQLHDLYQQHQDEFVMGETRDVQNIVLPDEATARKASAALASGKDFMAVAKQFAHQTPETVDLGWVAQKDLPAATAEVAFAAKQGAISQPFASDFGWSIVRVTGIKPAHTLSFDEAKPKLTTEAKQEAAGNALYALSNKVEDAMAAGADIKGLAQQFDLKPFTVPSIDQQGLNPAGTPVIGLPIAAADLAKTSFATQSGQLSELAQTNDGKFYVLHIDQVTPPTPRAFATVADQIKAAWIKDQQNAKLAASANAIIDALKKGGKLADIAQHQHLGAVRTLSFGHDGDATGTLPAELTSTLFTLPLGAASSAEGQQAKVDGKFVAVLSQIKPADPKSNPLAVQQLKQQLSADMGNELIAEFSRALRQHYSVQVNQAALDRLY